MGRQAVVRSTVQSEDDLFSWLRRRTDVNLCALLVHPIPRDTDIGYISYEGPCLEFSSDEFGYRVDPDAIDVGPWCDCQV